METETVREQTEIVLRLQPSLVRRIEALIAQPELGLPTFESFLVVAIHSFVSYKERELRRMEGRP